MNQESRMDMQYLIAALKENRVPKLSVLNGMAWTEQATELNLFALEERLVSLGIPFMQI